MGYTGDYRRRSPPAGGNLSYLLPCSGSAPVPGYAARSPRSANVSGVADNRTETAETRALACTGASCGGPCHRRALEADPAVQALALACGPAGEAGEFLDDPDHGLRGAPSELLCLRPEHVRPLELVAVRRCERRLERGTHRDEPGTLIRLAALSAGHGSFRQ
jgi:hypothetical protein